MKTQKELNAIKQEVETLYKKLDELTDEELIQVTGGLESHQHEAETTSFWKD